MNQGRRRFLRQAAVGAASLLATSPALAHTPSRIEHHPWRVRHPDLNGCCFAQLSDLHCDKPSELQRLQQAVRRINAQRPDWVFLTGDYVTWDTREIHPMAEALARLRSPSFAVLGNHDHYADAALCSSALRQAGVTVLSNQALTLQRGTAQVRIIGVDDLRTGHDRVDLACASLSSKDDLRIALCHVPDTVDKFAPKAADLILAGHTHGGQIRFVQTALNRLNTMRVGSRFLSGFYPSPAGTLYVNRGWGTVVIPWRQGAPAEITFFHCAYANERQRAT